MTDKEEWTLFRTYTSQEEAAIDRGLLQSNGITCVISNTTISSVYPMTDSWTPIELLIPTRQLPLAKELIK